MTADDAGWVVYDAFTEGTSSSRWEARAIQDAGGVPVLLCDDAAAVTYRDGQREVRIDRFTRSFDGGVQNLDNPKHLVVSTETFEIPEGGVGSFRVDMAAEKLHSGDLDYRDGFATFNVIDVDHKLVVDAISTGSRIHTIYELQARPVGFVAREQSFLYVIDNPELDVAAGPGSWHTYTVRIDRGEGRIEAFVDDRVLFRTGDAPVDPQRIKLGMGILTLWPMSADGLSTSTRGQGMAARWRNVCVRLSGPAA